jgi:hypothetical protein
MNKSILIDQAICLPAEEVETLIQGRSIATITQMFIDPEREFALYPTNASTSPLPLERYYNKNLQRISVNNVATVNSEGIVIKVWAKCELCQVIYDTEPLDILSKSTIWSVEGLEEILLEHHHIFLTYLRVYELDQPIEVRINATSQFIALSQPIIVIEPKPIISDRTFYKRKHQLETRQIPLHPQLETLQNAITEIAQINPIAEQLNKDIRIFLGWSAQKVLLKPDADLVWIKTIADIGNSSDGDNFEKIVRKSLIKLGFSNNNTNPKVSLDPNFTGGPGGLDFYCETPYPVVGECKATKTEKVPDGTAAQLVKLGYKHLQRKYNSCIKIIMAAGELTEDAELTANGNEMNVIRPETLQRLVELKAQHPGSINLLELKPCLEAEPFGASADGKINLYIDKVWQNIELRSHIVQLVKNADRKVGIEYISGAYDASNPPRIIFNLEEMHEILIELSSPLAGYLGREKGEDWKSDRFYFLRDLTTNPIEK